MKIRTSPRQAAAAAPIVEQPALWLGMAGFEPAQRVVLEGWLARPDGMPQWRVGALAEADAWLVNGPKVRVLPSGNLRVAAGLPTEHTLNLNLGEVDRPVAFAAPVPADFEPRCAFDPRSKDRLHAVLSQFDNWLSLLRSQFVLGKQLIEQRLELGRNVYHVTRRGSLLAVLDLNLRKVALAPTIRPLDLTNAGWYKRPLAAGGAPPDFVSCTPGQLGWQYVRRTAHDMLPPYYRSSKIYYRRVPRVPLEWLQDSHLVLLRELAAEPGELSSLVQRTGLPQQVVEVALACLYHASAITTTLAKAALPSKRRLNPTSPMSQPAADASAPQDSAPHDATVRASLEHKR